MISKTPTPPYYAAIFSIIRAKVDEREYNAMAERMFAMATQQDGFLGLEYSPEDQNGFSLSVSYWRDEDCIGRWKQNVEHLAAQKLGREKWYPAYSIRIARVERAYGS
jgi:heme-degrading monooxygenase HmoA